MATQTGSISFESQGGFQSYASGQYATLAQVKGQFATCSTAAGTQAKAATIVPTDSGWALYTGATITVKFTTANTHATPTLNVNSTGAKSIRDHTSAALTEDAYKWAAGTAMSFTYDGTYWRLQDTLPQRVTTAETAIEQTANNVLIKATETDTTAAQGGQHLIQSLINVAPSGVTIDADKVNIVGVITAINDDTTTTIDGGKITAYSLTLGEISMATQEALADYAKTATNYIVADSTGIKIADADPDTATTYQHQTSSETSYYVNGVNVAEFGSTARVGTSTGNHITVGSSNISMANGSTDIVEIAAEGAAGYYDRRSSISIGGQRGASLLLGTSSSRDDSIAKLSDGYGHEISVHSMDSALTYDGKAAHSLVWLDAEAVITVDEDDNQTGHPMSRLEHAMASYITHGSVGQTISVPANGYVEYPASPSVTSFGHTYSSAPDVIVSLYSTSTAAKFGGLSIAVSYVSTTGFRIRIFNNTDTARTPGFYWIAIG